LRCLNAGESVLPLARSTFRSPFCILQVLTTKTTRFALVVETRGEPQVYTLWQTPKKDRHLQTQIRLKRVMTIQRTESGTEFGCVGFIERPGAMYLEFAKSLKRFADQRIVGIKWELVKK
jgi:hypothetical protein